MALIENCEKNNAFSASLAQLSITWSTSHLSGLQRITAGVLI